MKKQISRHLHNQILALVMVQADRDFLRDLRDLRDLLVGSVKNLFWKMVTLHLQVKETTEVVLLNLIHLGTLTHRVAILVHQNQAFRSLECARSRFRPV